MNNPYPINPENLLRTLPEVLRSDEDMLAVATAVAEALAERVSEIDSIRIYTRIDELPEDLMDILAYDFKVDWWDGNYTLQEKRNTLKSSWQVHRTLGTKSAVEKAMSAIYQDTKVQEWFEYGGDPYHFKLLIDVTYQNVDKTKHQAVLDRVDFYKNLRSVLDEVEYYATSVTAPQYVATACVAEIITDSAVAHRY